MDPKSLIDQAQAIVLLISEGRIAYANEYAVSFYGYDNLIGASVVGTIVPKEETCGRKMETLIEDIEKDPARYSLNVNQNITASGDIVWIVWSNSQYICANGERMLLSVGIEATYFIERNRMLETVYNHSLSGIAMVDIETHVIDCNDSFYKMIGFDSKEELLRIDRDNNSTFRKYVDELSYDILDWLRDNDSVFVQHPFKKYGGGMFVADALYSKVRDQRGRVYGHVVNIHDNTDMYTKATTDPLTKIYNKMHFEALAEHEINIAWRYGTPLSVIMCDIDYFKKVNDTYGHLCGDLVLKEVTSEITKMLRDSDVFARVGGEEFAILLPVTTRDTAYEVAERIRRAIAERLFCCDGKSFSVTMSFGISELDTSIHRDKPLKELLALADSRLYASKNQGRNRTTL
jgi:diguanylate cyclase (GGDEF)-like protein/PAS domain S-box-containing protein